MAEVSDDQLALILEALEDAVFYRETRSRVLESAVRRHRQRSGAASQSKGDEHRDKAREYAALSVKLKETWRGGAPPPR